MQYSAVARDQALPWSRANREVRSGRHAEAMVAYLEALRVLPEAADHLLASMAVLRSRYRQSMLIASALEQARVESDGLPLIGVSGGSIRNDLSRGLSHGMNAAALALQRAAASPCMQMELSDSRAESLLAGLALHLLWAAEVRLPSPFAGAGTTDLTLLDALGHVLPEAALAEISLMLDPVMLSLLRGASKARGKAQQSHQSVREEWIQRLLRTHSRLSDPSDLVFVQHVHRLLFGQPSSVTWAHHARRELSDHPGIRLAWFQRLAQTPEAQQYLQSGVSAFTPEEVRGSVDADSPWVRRLPKPGDLQPSQIRLPLHKRPVVSVLIPVYCKLEFTLACLNSIAEHPPLTPFEVLVLDDHSPDGSADALQAVANLQVVQHGRNLGFIGSCNAGAQRARGEFLLFLNNDTVVTPGWLDALAKTFEEQPKAGLVGARLVYPDGRLQEAGGIVWRNGRAWNYGRGQDPVQPEFNYLREVDYCSGAALMIRHALFNELGGFDPHYAPAYYEDTDLAFKVRQKGLKVLYQPQSTIIHFEGITQGTSASGGLKAWQAANHAKFHQRWQQTLQTDHRPLGTDVFLARERVQGAPMVLVIDHHLPQSDRDAGSRSMWHIIRLLVAQGMVVKFWPHNRHYDKAYASWLEHAGIEVLAGPACSQGLEDWLAEHGQHLQTLLVSRPQVAVDVMPVLEKLAQRGSTRLLYYGHDIHHHRLQQELEVTGRTELRQQVRDWQEMEHQCWRFFRTVYYPAEQECEAVRKWWQEQDLQPAQRAARCIPVFAYTHAELDAFSTSAAKNMQSGRRQNILFVAGFNHPPNVDAALWLLEQVWPLVQRKEPNALLQLVGSNPPARLKALARPSVQVVGAVSEAELESYYQGAQVAVAPLLYGGGVKGKVIEAMCRGVPVVGTHVAAQGLPHGSAALCVAEGTGAFAAALLHLLSNEHVRQLQIRCGLEFVRKSYGAHTLWDVIRDDVLEEALS